MHVTFGWHSTAKHNGAHKWTYLYMHIHIDIYIYARRFVCFYHCSIRLLFNSIFYSFAAVKMKYHKIISIAKWWRLYIIIINDNKTIHVLVAVRKSSFSGWWITALNDKKHRFYRNTNIYQSRIFVSYIRLWTSGAFQVPDHFLVRFLCLYLCCRIDACPELFSPNYIYYIHI